MAYRRESKPTDYLPDILRGDANLVVKGAKRTSGAGQDRLAQSNSFGLFAPHNLVSAFCAH